MTFLCCNEKLFISLVFCLNMVLRKGLVTIIVSGLLYTSSCAPKTELSQYAYHGRIGNDSIAVDYRTYVHKKPKWLNSGLFGHPEDSTYVATDLVMTVVKSDGKIMRYVDIFKDKRLDSVIIKNGKETLSYAAINNSGDFDEVGNTILSQNQIQYENYLDKVKKQLILNATGDTSSFK